MDFKHLATCLLRQMECADGVIITKKDIVEKALREIFKAGAASIKMENTGAEAQLTLTSCL